MRERKLDLAKIEHKLIAVVMDPLGRLWKSVATEEVTISLPEVATLLNQSVLLQGQYSVFKIFGLVVFNPSFGHVERQGNTLQK